MAEAALEPALRAQSLAALSTVWRSPARVGAGDALLAAGDVRGAIEA